MPKTALKSRFANSPACTDLRLRVERMSLQHFFLEEQVIADEGSPVFALRLGREDLKHAKVLRLKPGEHIAVVDAAQDYFECEITDVPPDGMSVRVASRIDEPETGASVVLLQGIAKGEKMDTVIRQATELGVSAIVPLICERSVVKLDSEKASKRAARWRAIAKSAAMQSGRTTIPEISEPMSVKEAAALVAEATAVVVCWEESDGSASIGSVIEAGRVACSAPTRDSRIAVVVGPEGGLSENEVRSFLDANERAGIASLGSTILRTETAGVVASAIALYELGGLGNKLA